MKNKLMALFCISLGALSIPWNEGDATFFLLTLFFGVALFTCKEDCFDEEVG